MFNFLKGKKTETKVTLDRANGLYDPGEAIGITVEIVPDKDLKLKSASLRLYGQEEYLYRTISTSTDSEGNDTENESTTWGSTQLYAEEAPILGETTLPGGISQRYTVQMRLPADALPSCAGDLVRVRWWVDFKADRRLMGDLHATSDVFIRSLAPGKQVRGEYGESSEPGEAEMVLILPGLEATAGQSIQGQLRILPKKDFSAEVRLELVRSESVSYDEGNYLEVALPLKLAGSTQFCAGQQQIFPFQLAIPPNAVPTIETPHGSIEWTLKGILNRRLRKDTTVSQKIKIYPAKA